MVFKYLSRCRYSITYLSQRFKGTLVISEHNNERLNPITLNAISAGLKLGEVSCFAAGSKLDKIVTELESYDGLKQIILTDHEVYKNFLPEVMVPLLMEVQKKYNFDNIIFGSSSYARNVMPRLAAKLDVCPLSDVTNIKSAENFIRNIYAGNAFTDIMLKEPVKIFTIRGTCFEAVNQGSTKKPNIEKFDFVAENTKSKFVSSEQSSSDRPELSSAKRVISGGRGMKSGENFKILYELADKINAAVGASRAAVDSGFVANELQVGQTGKIVAPELYMAVGISGAIQHLAGMKDSKTIVAINKDPDAPIFQVADFGIVDDLFKVIPEMIKLVDKK